jgi:BirA family biotin operon repressor/biotin-[acetyl-CoA-carboxylase] ligase
VARPLLAAIGHWRARGLDAVRAAWVERGPALDTPLRLHRAGVPCEGRFAGLDGEGRLLLATPTGLLPVVSGEILG